MLEIILRSFDEALERFGVMFIKQNIGGKPMTAEELKLQISAVQSERDRLICYFLNTSVITFIL